MAGRTRTRLEASAASKRGSQLRFSLLVSLLFVASVLIYSSIDVLRTTNQRSAAATAAVTVESVALDDDDDGIAAAVGLPQDVDADADDDDEDAFPIPEEEEEEEEVPFVPLTITKGAYFYPKRAPFRRNVTVCGLTYSEEPIVVRRCAQHPPPPTPSPSVCARVMLG